MIPFHSWNVIFKIHVFVWETTGREEAGEEAFFLYLQLCASTICESVVWSIIPASMYELSEACPALLFSLVFLDAVWWLNGTVFHNGEEEVYCKEQS